MNRRQFVAVSLATTAVAGLVPGLIFQARRAGLAEAPDQWLGRQFTLDDGAILELESVEYVDDSTHCRQSRLHFRQIAGVSPVEGTYELHCGLSSQPLFLQPGANGPVACINRLVQTGVA